MTAEEQEETIKISGIDLEHNITDNGRCCEKCNLFRANYRSTKQGPMAPSNLGETWGDIGSSELKLLRSGMYAPRTIY